ncbi:alpha-N-acetylglucosaminidase isoform X2 [Ciona intestinalis]
MFASRKLVMHLIKAVLIVTTVIGIGSCQKYYIEKSLSPVRSYTAAHEQESAVEQLVQRIIGERSKDVVVSIQPAATEFALLSYAGTTLKITGSDAVSIAFAFNHYLKYYCRKQISWAGDQISDIPNPLPSVPPEGVTIKAGVKYRYYQNVCTVSYSSVWWNYRWEREIDWMALNGINLPLAFTGQEAIWEKVYKKLGCSDEDIKKHFAGPAFLAWGRMGNLHGWGGPLPSSWIKSQLILQHQILIRMRSLGMIPVLPGFAGHIPSAILNLYPKADVIQLSHWSHFNCTYSCTYLLQPHDPLFNTIGSMFIKEQMLEYNGTNHIYNADTFNEMTPPSSDPGYLSNASRAVYDAMAAADPDAIWLMQGWLFHNEPTFWKTAQKKALLTGVAKGKMLILDLFSESYPQYLPDWYFGQPFLWCMLHDFGGNMGFYGKINTVNTQPEIALTSANSTMVGTGVTPEGINQNYMMYDFMLETGFTVHSVNVTNWLKEYTMRRYNTSNPEAIKTWNILGNTIYNDTKPGFPSKSLIRGSPVKRPSLDNPGLPYWYQYSSLALAWDNFSQSLNTLKDLETVRYDAVDITRQMLQAIHRLLYYAMVEEFLWKRDPGKLGEQLLDLLDDFDKMLCSDAHFSMGKWIQDAKVLGTTAEEKNLYEYNARVQVTLWGPNGEILDYASKHWCSLVKHYYRPRWALFVSYLNHAYATKSKFDHKAFTSDVFTNVEEPFTEDRTVFPSTATGNAIELAKDMYIKWRPFLNDV